MPEIFVGRQPIYDRQLKVVGYELLFRSYEGDHAEFLDGDLATSQVILNTFTEIGLERLVGNGLAFINLTRSFILGEYSPPLAKHRVVLEILEKIPVDNELIEALRLLSARGYQLALDDVVDPHDVDPLLDIVDFVKLDLAAVERGRLEEHVATLRQHNVKLLAEKVETQDEFKLCRDLGFDYFQGYFLCRPNVVRGQRMPNTRLAIMRLLAKLQVPDIEFGRLEEIVQQDISLSYKLLRLINSAFYARPTEIKSIRQALTLLGIRQVQAWLALLVLSRIDDKPHELMITAMVRAKMCELLTLGLKEHSAETGFMIGLFSVLDALLDLPLEEVLASLPLAEEVTRALLHHEGQLGAVLGCVLAYERGNWEVACCLDLEPETICGAYLKSLDWASEVNSLLER